MPIDVREKKLEEAIEEYLTTTGGFIKDDGHGFDRRLALDIPTLIRFISTTQPKAWARYQTIYGADSEKALADRLCKAIGESGLVKVLRQGFQDRDVKFKVVYFKPETAMNEETVRLYEQNILTCVRQLHYSIKNENSLDMVLFVNGLPVVTLELKNQFTGQTVDDAIRQYKHDRSPAEPIFEFRNRALVHFAVDLHEVYMTTRLEGADTKFLPFNQGSGGAGNVGGKGNPSGETYPTAYLWEKVLCKNTLLEILQKYIHLQVEEKKFKGKVERKETLIFPRYHQLDVVTKLLADVKANGPGRNYLIQHSAGSGKSNSIAWLAHRLSALHNSNDQKIFASVIVVTDRKVLDSQLQDTIYQFDHKLGVVEKVDKGSWQLRDAINSGKGIIITTLQKFPVIYKEVRGDKRSFAIIVDEAHSSQTGEAAKKLKRALADTQAALEEYARIEAEAEAERKDEEDKLVEEITAHGQHKNLSFFAFTATPKEKTLQLFGDRQSDGTYRAFHIYSMRQAIEEGFILDVLKNYMTYKMYFKVVKNTPDDPEVSSSKGLKAVKRFESLHPHNLAQKTIVMVEHFRDVTRHKIGGKAKAMVVTSSRLHAVRYLFEFRRYIEEKGYDDLDVLVAFSGTVTDDGEDFTEEKLNVDREGKHIKETQLKEAFKSDDFNMLIVAEKYQTGFDEPLLHTMFVDKKLNGVKAVQTLSRLNRIHKGKDDTFVLDFVNTAEDIQAAFQPYYEATILEQETDPNLIYDLKARLEGFQLWQTPEVERFAAIYYKQGRQESKDLGQLASVLKPALDRYAAKPEDERLEIKSTMASFIRIYSFITQVCRMFDKDMQKLFVYVKFLQKLLPKGDRDNVTLDDALLLEYYRLEESFKGSIELFAQEGTVHPLKGETGAAADTKERLSEIIEKVNDKFGTSFTQMDKVMMQIADDFLADSVLVNFAKANDQSTFRHVFEKEFLNIAAQRYEQNEEFFIRMFNDQAFMSYVMSLMLPEVYHRLKSA